MSSSAPITAFGTTTSTRRQDIRRWCPTWCLTDRTQDLPPLPAHQRSDSGEIRIFLSARRSTRIGRRVRADPVWQGPHEHRAKLYGKSSATSAAWNAQDCDSPVRCPLAHEELRLEKFGRDRDGTWVDEIPNGNDHLIDTVRYTVRANVLRGEYEA